MAEKSDEKTKVSFRIPKNICDWLATEAKLNERTVNGQVVAILRERMGMNSPGNQATAE